MRNQTSIDRTHTGMLTSTAPLSVDALNADAAAAAAAAAAASAAAAAAASASAAALAAAEAAAAVAAAASCSLSGSLLSGNCAATAPPTLLLRAAAGTAGTAVLPILLLRPRLAVIDGRAAGASELATEASSSSGCRTRCGVGTV
mmetsp:Transcript_12697/g.28204  ORF Transcript_12697/g.28204 Transcript_12697/m.28204 type:complete len:145 (+) Transcript_12697:601-1035(+)